MHNHVIKRYIYTVIVVCQFIFVNIGKASEPAADEPINNPLSPLTKGELKGVVAPFAKGELPISDSPLNETVKLPDLIKTAYSENPGLKAARLRWLARIERYPQAVALEDPEFNSSYMVASEETKIRLTISQEIPFFNKLKKMGKIASKEAEIARLSFEKDARDIIAGLKESFYELAYFDAAILITQQSKEVLEHLAKLGAAEYSAKKDGTALNDVFKAQSQNAQASYDLILLSELRETEAAKINSVINRPIDTPVLKAERLSYTPFTYSLEELYKEALENREELKIINAEIDKAKEEKELASLWYLPNFMVGGGYEIGIGDTAMDSVMGEFGFTIPLWRGKYKGREREAELEVRANEYMKKGEENAALSEIKGGFFKVRNAERLIKLYKESLIPQAEQAMHTAEAWHKEGNGSFSGLLETQMVWLNFNLALERAVTDYYQYIARLERLTGKGLEGAR